MGIELEMNGNTATSYGKPLEGGGGTVCQESCSWLWLDHARNQFPYASCADISGSGRLFAHFSDSKFKLR